MYMRLLQSLADSHKLAIVYEKERIIKYFSSKSNAEYLAPLHDFFSAHNTNEMPTGEPLPEDFKDSDWKLLAYVNEPYLDPEQKRLGASKKRTITILDAYPVRELYLSTEINQTPKTSDDYLTIEEYAKEHNISPSSVYTKCHRGQLPGAKQFGRTWQIRKDTVWVSAKKAKTT